MNTKNLSILWAAAAAIAAPQAHGAIYTIPDFTNNSNATTHFNFDSAWSGTPAIDNIVNETSLYLKLTVEWTASADPGDFIVRYALDDNGGRSRADIDYRNGGFQVYQANSDADGDGAGTATTQPTVSIDPSAKTSVTLVLKVDQTLGTPGGDWNFGTIGQQSGANAFLYVDPNLATTEANNSTILAGWRSGQNGGYDSLSFVTYNLQTGNSFTYKDIALYTGDDTPFSAIPEPSIAFLGGLGLMGLLRRRRR